MARTGHLLIVGRQRDAPVEMSHVDPVARLRPGDRRALGAVDRERHLLARHDDRVRARARRVRNDGIRDRLRTRAGIVGENRRRGHEERGEAPRQPHDLVRRREQHVEGVARRDPLGRDQRADPRDVERAVRTRDGLQVREPVAIGVVVDPRTVRQIGRGLGDVG